MRKSGAFAVLLIIGALVALWIFFAAPRPARNTLENDPQRGQPTPRQDAVARKLENAAPKAAPEVAEPPPVIGPAPEEPDDPCVTEQPLWVPDYGPLLKRGGARAEFEVVDAQDNALEEGAFLSARLWRKLGSVALEDEADWDAYRQVVVCTGYSSPTTNTGAGLEPGEYDLEVDFRGYGCVLTSFSVSRGQFLQGRIRLPYYRRIVCLHFVDQNGTDVPYILSDKDTGGPYVIADGSASRQTVERESPAEVLRRPPGVPASPMTGMGFGGGSPTRRSQGKIVTDNGRFYVRAFAGAANSITVPLQAAIWGSDNIEIKDTCVSAQWDDYIVRLQLAPDFNERLQAKATPEDRLGGFVEYLKADPGQKSLLSAKTQTAAAHDQQWIDSKVLDERCTRVLVQLQAPADIHPVFWYAGSPPGGSYGPKVQLDGAWPFDMTRGAEFEVCFTDDKLFTSASQRFSAGPNTSANFSLSVSPARVELRLKQRSPTLAASWHSVNLSIKGVDAGPRSILNERFTPLMRCFEDRRLPIPCEPADGGFVLSTALSEDMLAQLRSQPHEMTVQSSNCGGSGAAHGFSGYGIRRTEFVRRVWDLPQPDSPLRAASAQFTLGSAEIERLQAGAVEFDLPATGLALRAVSQRVGGLPFVHGTILDYETDRQARAVRRRLIAAEKNGRSPRFDEPAIAADPAATQANADFAAACASVGPDTPEDKLKELMGAANYNAFATRAQREFFCRNNAWYDTRKVVQSDGHGYIVAPDMKFVPGKRYVLYLWSNTRNDSTPDLRIDFIADKSGLADLGAVLLPDYR